MAPSSTLSLCVQPSLLIASYESAGKMKNVHKTEHGSSQRMPTVLGATHFGRQSSRGAAPGATGTVNKPDQHLVTPAAATEFEIEPYDLRKFNDVASVRILVIVLVTALIAMIAAVGCQMSAGGTGSNSGNGSNDGPDDDPVLPDFSAHRIIASPEDAGEPGAWRFIMDPGDAAIPPELRLLWDFGEDERREGITQQFVYACGGKHTVSVTLCDEQETEIWAWTIDIVVDLPDLSPEN